MANSADPDQPTELALHCFQRQGIYGISRARVKKCQFLASVLPLIPAPVGARHCVQGPRANFLWSLCTSACSPDVKDLLFGHWFPAHAQPRMWHMLRRVGVILLIWIRPADTWRLYNVASTSMQRHDVASTLRRRCINVMCTLGVYCPRLDKLGRFFAILHKVGNFCDIVLCFLHIKLFLKRDLLWKVRIGSRLELILFGKAVKQFWQLPPLKVFDCLFWGFTAQSIQWGHVERGQFT